MNTPSYSVLLNRDNQIRAIQELYENVNDLEVKKGIEFESGKNAIEVDSEGGVYIYGIGGYDGTNAGEAGVQTLQEVLAG